MTHFLYQPEIMKTACLHLSVWAVEHEFMPKVLNTYAANRFAIALWSHGDQPGFSVLQAVAGVWVVVGAGFGHCDASTLHQHYGIPQADAESLHQKISGS